MNLGPAGSFKDCISDNQIDHLEERSKTCRIYYPEYKVREAKSGRRNKLAGEFHIDKLTRNLKRPGII